MPQTKGKPYIYLRKDGRYEGRYRKYLSSNKKEFQQVSVYGATYEEALEKVLREQKVSNQILTEGMVSINTLTEQWLLEIQKILKPSSYAIYQNYARKYLLPNIGNRYANTFNESSLIAVLESFQKGQRNGTALAQGTVYIIEEILRAIFRYGAEKKLIPKVDFGKVKYRTKNTKEANPLSELELQQLLERVKVQEMEIQIMVMLPLYTGISLSELCGLKWEDLNLEKGSIHICRNLKRIQQLLQGNGKEKTATTMAEYDLKKEECRNFELPEIVWQFLKEVASKNRGKKGYYVLSFSEKYAEGRTMQYRLKSLGQQIGIEQLNFRMLRDTFAVMCLKARGDIYTLAYILGITVSAACDRYQEWIIRDEGFLKRIG